MAPVGGALPTATTEREGWSSRTLKQLQPDAGADSRSLWLVVAAGAVAATVCGTGVGGIGAFVLVAAVAALLVAGGVRRRQAAGALACAVSVAAMLAVRDSGWLRAGLVPLAFACLVAAVIVARRGSWFDLPWVRAVAASAALALQACLVPAWLGRGLRVAARKSGWLRFRAIGRLTLLVVPILIVLTALLASADALFASMFDVDLQAATVRSWWFGVGAACFAALLRGGLLGVGEGAAPAEATTTAARRSRLSELESVATLAVVAAVLAVFVATRVFAKSDAGRAALANRGVSYAQYARSGYLQLLAVVALVAVVLVVVDRMGNGGSARARAWQRVLALVIVALALAVVVIALRRLALYCEAYGLTMLRLTCVAGALWIVIVLGLLALSGLGLRRHRNWMPGAAGLALLVVTVGFAVVNPQRIVVEYDVDHAASAPLDLRYLTSMSADSVPSLVAALPHLTAGQSDYVVGRLCRRFAEPVSWSDTNLARITARRVLEPVCSR